MTFKKFISREKITEGILTEDDRVGEARGLLERLDYAFELMDKDIHNDEGVVFDNNGTLNRHEGQVTTWMRHLTYENVEQYLQKLEKIGFLKTSQLRDAYQKLKKLCDGDM